MKDLTCNITQREVNFLTIIFKSKKLKPRPQNGIMVPLKAGVHPKAVFRLGIMVFTQISRLFFKQSNISMLISHIYVSGFFFVFFGVFFGYIWGYIVFLKVQI